MENILFSSLKRPNENRIIDTGPGRERMLFLLAEGRKDSMVKAN